MNDLCIVDDNYNIEDKNYHYNNSDNNQNNNIKLMLINPKSNFTSSTIKSNKKHQGYDNKLLFNIIKFKIL